MFSKEAIDPEPVVLNHASSVNPVAGPESGVTVVRYPVEPSNAIA